ncbi:MAG: NADH-quinone oxidoreductase subunit M [Candidatus Eremiobacteraeota bacterium]|nr:NADH-quinone oxidoreductase subunit M [Candidatus Eremiobacteraeota bacterium]MBC5807042.1 NADH-quinone oxidoreductase subunit M [Candidatus Eremiobacteraeota bacterium]
MLINAVIFAPLLTAVLLLFVPRTASAALKGIALAGALITFVLSLTFLGSSQNGAADQSVAWISGTWLASYHVRIDSLRLFFVLLTTLVSVACIWAAFSYADEARLRGYLFLLLAFETTLLGLFTAADLLLFYVYWDLMLIPVFLLLVGYAHSAAARRAAWYYLIYNGAGGLVLLLGVIALVAHTHSFEVLASGAPQLSGAMEWWIFLSFALAFLIKTPAFPFHSWMPPTYTHAPTPVVAMVAGVQSKAGLFALLAFGLPLFPHATRALAPILLVLAVCSIIYGALAALGQRDMKTLVAFSSLSHLGLVWLALFAFDITSVSASILMLVSHGLIAAALFLLMGFVEERVGTRDLAVFGGLALRAPRLQALMLIAAMGALGLPGLSGFAGEFLILIGSWQTQPLYTAIALLAVVLATVYVLQLFQGILHRPLRADAQAQLELRPREIWLVAPLLAAIFFLGLWPGWLNDRTPMAISNAGTTALQATPR